MPNLRCLFIVKPEMFIYLNVSIQIMTECLCYSEFVCWACHVHQDVWWITKLNLSHVTVCFAMFVSTLKVRINKLSQVPSLKFNKGSSYCCGIKGV